MKPSQRLIDALRRAADRIEAPGSDYFWLRSESCNCGILAQELGVPSEFMNMIGSWDYAIERGYCTVTRIPVAHVFSTLHEAGLTDEELSEIEHMGADPCGVARYFRLLAEQLAAQQPAPAKPAEPVGCCHMWLECGVCMLCSATKPAEQKELV